MAEPIAYTEMTPEEQIQICKNSIRGFEHNLFIADLDRQVLEQISLDDLLAQPGIDRQIAEAKLANHRQELAATVANMAITRRNIEIRRAILAVLEGPRPAGKMKSGE